MCSKSETISKIAAALVAFSGEVKSISHDANNPHFKSQYTSLDHMIDETKPILTKHGLTIMQFPGGDGERITVRTMILHTSGEWMESEPLTLKAVKTDPQGAGSAITYARRYSYAAALSLSLGDDDDGNASSYAPQNRSYSAPTSQPSQTPPRASQTNTGQSSASSGGSTMARVYKLREELGWSWPDLNQFAGEVLNREVKFLKNDVKENAEWLKIEQAMIATKNGYQQHGGMEGHPIDIDQGELPF